MRVEEIIILQEKNSFEDILFKLYTEEKLDSDNIFESTEYGYLEDYYNPNYDRREHYPEEYD